MSTEKIRELHLVSRPTGALTANDFKIVEVDKPQIKDGEALIKVLYLSVDPYFRPKMRETKSYTPPFELNKPLKGDLIGLVEESKCDKLQNGDLISAAGPWSEYFVITEGSSFNKLEDFKKTPAIHLSILGMVGLTSYFGLIDIGRPQEGETLVVSAAAGAVGSIVGQIGKIKGMKVIGIVGSQAKADWITKDLGFDKAINYRTENLDEMLDQYCPNGIDIYYDNVGGKVLETVLLHLNKFGRIVCCGHISNYDKQDEGVKNLDRIVFFRLKMQGFIVWDYSDRYDEGLHELKQWFDDGKLKFKHTIVQGLENAPDALLGLFTGENTGKMLVRIPLDAPKA